MDVVPQNLRITPRLGTGGQTRLRAELCLISHPAPPSFGLCSVLLQPATFLIPSVCGTVYLGFFPAVAVPDLSLHRLARGWIFFPPTFGLLLPSQPELSNLATVHYSIKRVQFTPPLAAPT